jgi:hypothetical protein
MVTARSPLLILLLALAACESDEKKLARLENERNTQCLLAQAYEDRYTAARFLKGMTREAVKKPITPEADSVGRRWIEHRRKCDHATREYNRFMR